MVEDTVTRVEQIERSHYELREILIKDWEEHQEQLTQMMEIIIRMSRWKRIVEDIGLVNKIARMQGITKGPAYNPYHLVEHAMLEASTPYYPIPPMVNNL